MQAVVRAIDEGQLAAEAALVASNRREAFALRFARDHAIPAICIPTAGQEDAADEQLARALADARADLVLLSGYLKKIGPKSLAAFRGRMLNVHPSLLPKHGGAGMFGRRVHEAVLQAGDTVTGASVHVVNEAYDEGALIDQSRAPVEASDTAADIERKVMAAEVALVVKTLRRIAEGALPLPLP